MRSADTRARAVVEEPLPAGTWSIAASAPTFDHAYLADGLVDVPNDGRFHDVALCARNAPVELTIIVVPRVSSDAVRVATMRNPLAVPLLPGPADVYWGDELLVTAPVRMTPAGGDVHIGLGVEERLKVARNVAFEEETKGLLASTTHLRHEVVIDIGSRLPDAARIEVRERLPTRDETEKEDLDVTLLQVDPPWEEYPQIDLGPVPVKGGRRWRFELAPGAERRLVFAYVVKHGAKLELVGGTRRE